MRRRRRRRRRSAARISLSPGGGFGSSSSLGSLGGSRRSGGWLRIAVPLLIGAAFVGYQYCSADEQTVPITGREQRVSLSDEQQMQLGAQYYDRFVQESSGAIVESGPQYEMVTSV